MSEKLNDISTEDLMNVTGGEDLRPCIREGEIHDFAVVEVIKTGHGRKVHFRCTKCGYEYWKNIF